MTGVKYQIIKGDDHDLSLVWESSCWTTTLQHKVKVKVKNHYQVTHPVLRSCDLVAWGNRLACGHAYTYCLLFVFFLFVSSCPGYLKLMAFFNVPDSVSSIPVEFHM